MEKFVAFYEWGFPICEAYGWMYDILLSKLVAASEWGVSIYGENGQMLCCRVVLLLPSSGGASSTGQVDGCTVSDRVTAIEGCIVLSRRIKR